MERVLLHSCCAPCSVYCVDTLRQEGVEPTSLWFNPNIHPYQEYRARRDTLIGYGERVGMDVRVLDDQGQDIELKEDDEDDFIPELRDELYQVDDSEIEENGYSIEDVPEDELGLDFGMDDDDSEEDM